MTDIQAWLDQGRTLADQATEGPWVSEWVEDDDWHEIYGHPFDGMVCPQVATTQGGGENEAAFIADARTRLPQALNALQAVLDLHKAYHFDGYEDGPGGPAHHVIMCSQCEPDSDRIEYPCSTVRAIQDAIKEQDA